MPATAPEASPKRAPTARARRAVARAPPHHRCPGRIVRRRDLVRQAAETSMELARPTRAPSSSRRGQGTPSSSRTLVGPPPTGSWAWRSRPIRASPTRSSSPASCASVRMSAPRSSTIPAWSGRCATRPNMVTVPLKSVEGRPLGVMQVLNKTEGDFTETDVECWPSSGRRSPAPSRPAACMSGRASPRSCN